MSVVIAWLVVVGLLPLPGCHGLDPPRADTVVRPFGPVGRWEGHWGIDVGVPEGSPVHPIGPGIVSFSGVVVANHVVSVDHGGGVLTSYSYLGASIVPRGTRVGRRTVIGVSGLHDGRPAYHLSLRIAGRYLDPLSLRRCHAGPAVALYLAAGGPYPHVRARHPRRDLRSTPHRPSRGRQCRPRTAGCRGRAVDTGR